MSSTTSESDDTSSSDSDLEEFKTKRKRRKSKKKRIISTKDRSVGRVQDPISSLNPYYICDQCKRQYKVKASLIRHIAENSCGKNAIKPKIVCRWCKVEFKNRGNLAHHARHMHGDDRYKNKLPTSLIHTCKICKDRSYKYKYELTYHIRRMHMNLIAKIPYAEEKKVNQVWFEKVLNTNTIMEIKKAGENTLIMRPLNEKTNIKINNDQDNLHTIDLTHLYPVGSKKYPKKQCPYCKKMYMGKDLKKHIEEVHLNIKKFACNNCNRTFKRPYHYLQHICNKARKTRGVTQNHKGGIFIASVESLSVPLGL